MRQGGNVILSEGLVLQDAFAKGASESGNTVTEVVLKDKTIGDCMGCGACQKMVESVFKKMI